MSRALIDPRIDYLARTAYRTHRSWTAGAKHVSFEQLSQQAQKAWREVAAVLWQEIWTDARPPVLPSPARHPRLSWAAMLDDPARSGKLDEKE